MTDINDALRTATLADPAVAALVGTRVYSDYLPQETTVPAITFFCVDTIPNECLTMIADVSHSRYQFDCYAMTRPAANALAETLRLALEKKHRGDNDGQFINEIQLVGGAHHGLDDWERGAGGRRFITSLDFMVHYRVAIS